MARARMRRSSRYAEGDIFVVPLPSGGVALGLVARRAPRGGIAYGYFFRPVRAKVPSLEQIPEMGPASAVLGCRFGDLRLAEGDWQVLGPLTGWDRTVWQMPWFCVPSDGLPQGVAVKYADNDPTRVEQQVEVSHDECEKLPRDEMFGSDFLAIELDKRLTGHPEREHGSELEDERWGARIFIEFGNAADASDALAAVEAAGFVARLEVDEVGVELTVDLPADSSDDEIDTAELSLARIAERFGGTADGRTRPV